MVLPLTGLGLALCAGSHTHDVEVFVMAILLFAVPDALHANFRHVAGTASVRAQMHREGESTLLRFVKGKWMWCIVEHSNLCSVLVLHASTVEMCVQ